MWSRLRKSRFDIAPQSSQGSGVRRHCAQALNSRPLAVVVPLRSSTLPQRMQASHTFPLRKLSTCILMSLTGGVALLRTAPSPVGCATPLRSSTCTSSITSSSVTGNCDMMAFMGDFTKSFMALLRQLVRHGHNVERSFTPMPADGENPGEFRVTKVAVSPLSYGPVSDHVLSNALLRSIAAARFGAAETTRSTMKSLMPSTTRSARSERVSFSLPPGSKSKSTCSHTCCKYSGST